MERHPHRVQGDSTQGQAVDRPQDVPLAEAALARLAW